MRTRTLIWFWLFATLSPGAVKERDKPRWVVLLANRSGVIEAVDADSLQQIGTIRVGSMTDWVAARSNGQMLVVALPQPREPNSCCAMYSLDLGTRTMVQLNSPTIRGVFSADGNELFVQRGNIGIDIVDLLTLTRRTTFGPLGKSYFLQRSPYRRWLFGLRYGAPSALDLFDLKTNTLARSISLPGGLHLTGTWEGLNYLLLGYGKGKGTLWSVTPDSNELGEGKELDLQELGGDCRVPNSRAREPLFLQPPVAAGGRLFVYEGFGFKFDRRVCATPSAGGIYVIDTASGALVTHLAPSLYFMQVVPNCDGTELYAIEVGPSPGKQGERLIRLDSRTGKILAVRDLREGMTVNETLALLDDSLIPRGEVQAKVVERPAWMAACPVTQPTLDEPARDPMASRFGFGEWYVSQDRRIWFPRQDWHAGESNKVLLARPAGERLDITSYRLDATAPEVHIGPGDFASDYPGGTFEVIGLTFPSEGCWEMRVKAKSDELRFTTTVAPARRAPVAGTTSR